MRGEVTILPCCQLATRYLTPWPHLFRFELCFHLFLTVTIFGASYNCFRASACCLCCSCHSKYAFRWRSPSCNHVISAFSPSTSEGACLTSLRFQLPAFNHSPSWDSKLLADPKDFDNPASEASTTQIPNSHQLVSLLAGGESLQKHSDICLDG